MHIPTYRLAPFTSRVRNKLGLPSSLATLASRSWEVAPAIETQVPPALFDEQDLSRISGVAPPNSLANQVKKARGGLQRHSATLAHELHDAVLCGGHVFTKRLTFRIDTTPVPLFAPPIEQEFDAGVLANSHFGLRYFGHWLIDDLPRAIAAEQLGKPVSALQRPSAHQTDYLAALGIDMPTPRAARFKRLVILEDFGQNLYKRQRYGMLRETLRKRLRPSGGRKVMLLRGESGARRLLVNEQEVAAAMKARGFEVFDPLHARLEDMAAACLDAEVVLGVEGSQLANGVMWMKTTGTLVVIQPPQYFDMYFKGRCDCEGMRYAFIVAEPRSSDAFWLDINPLQRLLDRLPSI